MSKYLNQINIHKMEQYLYTRNFTKKSLDNNNYYYLEYKDNIVTIIYINKATYGLYLQKMYNINIIEKPDEAFIIIKNGNIYCKLIEKKFLDRYSNKNPLKTGATNIQLYDMELNNGDNGENKFRIKLSYSINNYVDSKLNSDNPENINIKKILNKLNINTFNSEDDNYYNNIFNWILTC